MVSELKLITVIMYVRLFRIYKQIIILKLVNNHFEELLGCWG